MDEIKNFAKHFLVDTDSHEENDFREEFILWKGHWKDRYGKLIEEGKSKETIESVIPHTALKSLNLCNSTVYPNVSALLKTLATLPFTSVECERNNSALKRLKTYTRSTMSQDRLQGLALMYIHRDVKISPNEVVRRFFMQSRRV